MGDFFREGRVNMSWGKCLGISRWDSEEGNFSGG